MSDSVKNSIKVAIKEEVIEGTYEAPAAATDFIQPMQDGLELNFSRDTIERNVFNGSIGKTTPRVGMKSVSGAISVEAKAHGTAGSAPEYGLLLESALGAKRSITTTTTTKASGNTGTVLQIEDADISKFNIGDIIMVKQSGAYHVSPILSKTTGTGTATITLLVAHPSGDMTDSVVIEKSQTYYTAEDGHPTISVTKYIEDAVKQTAWGCRVKSMALNNFSVGKTSDWSFGLEGLDYNNELDTPDYTPSYNSALPALVLSAYVYVDGTAVAVTDVNFSLENTVAFKTATQAANGKMSSRITERQVSGSFTPYLQDDSIANYTKYSNNTEFSVFGYMAIPTSTAGEFKDVIGFYLPKCVITDLKEQDADGLLQESITFSATRGTASDTEELYISSI